MRCGSERGISFSTTTPENRMGSRNRRRRKRARENANANTPAAHFATIPTVPAPAVAPMGGVELEQFAVIHGSVDKFSRDLKERLDHGWRVIPGCLAGGGGLSGGSQFVCVLELPPAQTKT